MTRDFHDDLGRAVRVPQSPRRIVSLCPSLTETLFALGLGPQIVGRTRYCVHPADRVAAVPVVGGTKDVDVRAVLDLRPDLAVAAKEENRPEVVEALAAAVAVYVVDVRSYEQALAMIVVLGALTDRPDPAAALMHDIMGRFARLPCGDGRRTAYLVWREPYMAAGRDTYVHSLLERCGLVNVCAGLPGRYPEVSLAQLQQLSPDVLLLPSEPFRFEEQHRAALAPHFPRTDVRCVDGEMFSWYGARMRQAADYLAGWLKTLESGGW